MSEPSPIDNAFTGPMLGGAEEPTYAGALSFMRRRFTKSLDGVDVAIWGVPFDGATSNRPGTRFGPAAIRRASPIFDGDPQYPSFKDPFAHMAVIDYGDCVLPRGVSQEVPKAIQRQASDILSRDVHLISLGGDHFITLPLLRAHVAKHGPLAVVQIDAHQDTWDDGPDAITHGSFMNIAANEGLIDAKRSIQVGIRTVAPRDCGFKVVHAMECAELGPQAIAGLIRERVGSGPCYLTFDIDGLDPAFAPGTGTPVAGGLSSAQALGALWQLRDLDWRGMDVVEVSPPYDHADMTAIAAASVVQRYLQILAEKRAH
ncbi:agmatinase [Methylovirgula sp. 4M-Z18]|uniref:agmatinase n=1 Tax=Methylovirgula sp. 4M-Z18 TaxID=2293567 RepID=UPI000E2ED03E|nr:agmatinase [Methylovirgula sp. 4M-Z18]RFB80985.1 agmatinase [Methylovirgula sp. 4M-Z18]